MKIVLASSNKGKIREFTAILKPLDVELIPQSELDIPDAEETGLSFIENALLKARHAARKTGLPAIADDSGLCVYALRGAPGIYSARYAGSPSDAEANIKKLLSELDKVSDTQRSACFYCTIAFVNHADDPIPLVCDGKWEGRILSRPSGTNGFGYDPVFYVPDKKLTAAELPSEIKNQISHRGAALQQFIRRLPEKFQHDGTIS